MLLVGRAIKERIQKDGADIMERIDMVRVKNVYIKKARNRPVDRPNVKKLRALLVLSKLLSKNG